MSREYAVGRGGSGRRRGGQGANRDARRGHANAAVGRQGRRVRRDGAGSGRHEEADAGAQHRWRRNQGAGRACRPDGSTGWARTWSITASTTFSCTAPPPSRSWTTSPARDSRWSRSTASSTGIARGCRAHGMALAGGETAQMPGLYQPGTYDLAGTIVGVVEEDRALHGDAIVPGDVLLGYASTGLHTNGYTLARRIVFDRMRLELDDMLGDTGPDGRRRAARRPPQLRAERRAGSRPTARTRAHHRRRDSWQSRADTARRVRGGRGSRGVGPAAALLDPAAGRRRIHRGDARRVQPRRGTHRRAAVRGVARGTGRRAGRRRRDLADRRDPPRHPRPSRSRGPDGAFHAHCAARPQRARPRRAASTAHAQAARVHGVLG